MCMLARVFGAILLLGAATDSPARADQIYLEGGRVLEGDATVEGDKVQVLLESGRISLARGEVLRIEETPSALQEARQREAALAPHDVTGLLRLADFCRDHDLPNRERTLLERIVALEPDHAEARRRLGFVREGKLWVDRTEVARREQLERTNTRQARLELAQKQAALELAEAQLARERKEREADRAQTQQRAEPSQARAAYAPYVGPYSWLSPMVFYTGPLPRLTPPRGPPPFSINGAQHPADPSFSIPGVRPPASYFEGAFDR
jgi:hypothetical protein